MQVTILKPIVHRAVMYGLKVPVRYRFQLKKQLLVGCREQLRKKDTEFDSKVSHLMKSMKLRILLLF